MKNDENELIAIIEGMLFINGEEGIDINLVKDILDLPTSKIRDLINKLNEKYKVNSHGILIVSYNSTKYRMTTLSKYYEYFVKLKKNFAKKKKLSIPILEVLSIIAYKGPITKMDIERIRGINSDYIIGKLWDLDLIKKCDRKNDLAGRPFLFKVTEKFMKEFNLNSLKDLPQIDLDLNLEAEELFNN